MVDKLMLDKEKKNPWYAAGLHFECSQCGQCCSGPGQGYIWVTKPEIKLISNHLKITGEQFRKNYTKLAGRRTTLLEQPISKDCIFLRKIDGQKGCIIYSVRPNQCRTWPFWADNLQTPNAWNKAAKKCSGINRGKLYSLEEIEKNKTQKKWWLDENQ